MKTRIPADLFDHLQQSAEKYGGIGAGFTYEALDSELYDPNPRMIPCCLHGHLEVGPDGEIMDRGTTYDNRVRMENAIAPRGEFLSAINDSAVWEINKAKGAHPHRRRVSWQEYTEYLGWERGE